MTQSNLSMKQMQIQRHRKQTWLAVAKQGDGEGLVRSLGLTDANCYIENG